MSQKTLQMVQSECTDDRAETTKETAGEDIVAYEKKTRNETATDGKVVGKLSALTGQQIIYKQVKMSQ